MHLVKDTWLNVLHYLRTHPPFGQPKAVVSLPYENEGALDMLISKFPDECRLWLESVYNNEAALR